MDAVTASAAGGLIGAGSLPGASGAAVPSGLTEAQALLLLLVAGHLLGDFLFQTRRMAVGKTRPGVLLQHASMVAVVHLAALMPFLAWPTVAAVLAVSVAHGTIDAAKARWRRAWPGRLGLFLADQAAHLIVLLGAWVVLLWLTGTPASLLGGEWLAYFISATTIAAAFALALRGGSEVVTGTLTLLGLSSEEGSVGLPGGGQLIGMLERTLTLILILFDQWATVALLLTAKSIARFEELKERRFSEYYLVGTLTSLTVAIVIGLALRSLLS